MSKSKLTPAEILEALTKSKNGNLNIGGRRARVKTLYIAQNLNGFGTGRTDLIKQSTTKVVGVTNFDGGNKLNSGRDVFVLAARILGETVATTPQTSTWKSDLPASVINGEIHISQGSDLTSMPITDLHRYGASLSNEDNFREFLPFLIEANKEFSIQTELAAAVSTDILARLELRVVEFVD